MSSTPARRSDPSALLKDLKTSLQLLRASSRQLTAAEKKFNTKYSSKITDANPYLSTFCKSLECCFLHGIQTTSKSFFPVVIALTTEEKKRHHGLNALVRHMVGEMGKIRCLQSDAGRGRYFLRCCLAHGWVNSLVMSIRTWKDSDQWYRSDSLLVRTPNESVMEIFPALEILHFDLYLGNRGFLDFGWELPLYKRYELVPCTDLGLMICSVRGRIIVSKVKHQSIAGEDGKVCTGDLLDEVDATPTFGMAPEEVAQLVRRCGSRNRPVAIAVCKAEWRDGRPYPPIMVLLKDIGFTEKSLQNEWYKKKQKWRRTSSLLGDCDSIRGDGDDEFDPLLDDEEDDDDEREEATKRRARKHGAQDLLYIGSLKVGRVGDSSILDKAISRVIQDHKKVHHAVALHIQELGVKMFCTDSGNQVLNYAYPEVSAVGCWSSDLHYLALIAGNDVCPAATEYLCHVFYCADADRARAIVAAVGQGFDRTQDAV